jgi:non-ribosomal peptide synthetase-like protein
MAGPTLAAVFVVFLGLTFAAWRRYLWAAEQERQRPQDSCPYSLTEVWSDSHLLNVPHQAEVRWLPEVFSRSAKRYPHRTALQIPHTGEALTFAELDARAESVAAALSPLLSGPDQVVAVAMTQDNWQIVACHLGILKAGGTVMFLDATLPDALVTHMLEDAQPVVVLTRGQESFRDLPTLDVLALPETASRRTPPPWMDDPTQRVATLFYTSGTTGMPKGVECPHAGYVNLVLSYADYFDLIPGMDATSLTSSLGYDGSISEMYSAWVSGCSVVLLTKEELRSGPDLVPVLREAEVTVLFCPPVLLTTLSANPELDIPYPLCRYVVPAGEAFPPSLVEPWTRGRRQIINTYGPTEASTDTSRQSLRPGEPVTIGTPLANVTYVILEVDGLRPLPHGEVGELCIGGVHVARGYRNLPELTARKFITHPRFGRLYRTGDRCKIDVRSSRVHFLGRVDAQLKVRGHRVETQPVEDILQTQFSEIEAAVLDYRNQQLVAFVAAPSIAECGVAGVAPAPPDWAARVTARLARQLPAPSVPTRIFLVDEFVMKPVSGKIDRDRLPDLSQLVPNTEPQEEWSPGVGSSGTPGEPLSTGGLSEGDSKVDPAGAEVLEICRDVLESPLGWDDAFADHGGHSIAIARLAYRLQASGWAVPVRALLDDCNTARKVAGCPRGVPQALATPAAAAEYDPGRSGRDEAAAKVLSIGAFTTLQLLFLLLLYSPLVLGLVAALAFGEIGEFFARGDIWEFIGVGLLMYLGALVFPFASLLGVRAIRRFMGEDIRARNLTPGVYPKWSRMHLRAWCIGRMQESVLMPLGAVIRSAPLMAYALRRLGATVGANLQCAHDVTFSGPLGLLRIGDDVAIQPGAYLCMSRWVNQELHVGPVHLESGCKIGVRAGIANHVKVGRGSWVTPFTPILSDVGPEGMWEGAPARFAGRCMNLSRTANGCRNASPVWVTETLNIVMQVLFEFCLLVAPTAGMSWGVATFMSFGGAGLGLEYFETTPLGEIVASMGLYVFVTSWLAIVLSSVLGCVFLRFTSASPGLYPTRGLGAALLLYRVKKMNQLQRLWSWTITGQYLRALAGVRFSRLGVSECDLMLNLVPELATADARVFWSHGCFTNMLDYGAEHLKLCQLDMPANFFSGNNCVAESGHFPSNFLLGVSSPANDIQFRNQMQSRLGEPITVAGNPPLRFGIASSGKEGEARQLPSFPLFLARVSLNDLFSIGILPISDVFAYAVFYTTLIRLGVHPVVGALLALLLAEIVLVLSCVLVKKALVGRWGSAHSTGFWSLRHFTYFFAQDCFFSWCRTSLGILAGTVLPNVVLRWMGCRIGKRTIVSSPLGAYDWNAVHLGNDCIIDGFLQLHSFEGMVLKVKRTEIEDGSAVNFGATVMGGAILAPETTLLPLSLVLKEARLHTGVHEGSPAEPASPVCDPASPMAELRSGGTPPPFGEAAGDIGGRPATYGVPDESTR